MATITSIKVYFANSADVQFACEQMERMYPTCGFTWDITEYCGDLYNGYINQAVISAPAQFMGIFLSLFGRACRFKESPDMVVL